MCLKFRAIEPMIMLTNNGSDTNSADSDTFCNLRRRLTMGAKKMNPGILQYYPPNSIDQYFADAFGPRPAKFRKTSLCGWSHLMHGHMQPVSDDTSLKKIADSSSLMSIFHLFLYGIYAAKRNKDNE